MRTIAHISDLHFGRLDVRVAEGLVADLEGCKPTLLVVSGDLTQRARDRQFLDAAAFLARLPRPQLIVPGNHDVPLWNVMARFFYPLRGYRERITQELFPAYVDEELAVLGINTARGFTQASGWTTPDQIRAVCERFSKMEPGVLKVLVTHHPFVPPSIDPHGDILLNAVDSLAQLEGCDLDVVLAGHLHRAYSRDVREFHRRSRESVLSIQSSTSTSTRRRGEPNSYNWITIERDRVRIEIRAWDGEIFRASSRGDFRRAGAIWEQQGKGVSEETDAITESLIAAPGHKTSGGQA